MPDYSLPYRLYSYSNCRTTKLMFTLIANVAKSSNDLYFMNRFHSDVYSLCLSLILMLEQELKESIYFNIS